MGVLGGSCLCGKVRIAVHGAPIRVGICHCWKGMSRTRSPILDGQNIRHSFPFSDQKLLLSWGPKYRFPAQAFYERVYGHA
ncbi:GFA family protein [Rhizobium brockwellii]